MTAKDPQWRDPKYLCTAHRSAGRGPCRAYAVAGSNVCRVHGGASPQAKKRARERLDAAAMPAIAALTSMLTEGAMAGATDPASCEVRRKAANDLLDRIPGFGRGKNISVDATVQSDWTDPREAAASFAAIVEQERERLRAQRTTLTRVYEVEP
jgi:hypothetical protein